VIGRGRRHGDDRAPHDRLDERPHDLEHPQCKQRDDTDPDRRLDGALDGLLTADIAAIRSSGLHLVPSSGVEPR
jgi:hypothetical protein